MRNLYVALAIDFGKQLLLFNKTGGGDRNRTDLDGFAGRCITSLLPRHYLNQ